MFGGRECVELADAKGIQHADQFNDGCNDGRHDFVVGWLP